MSAKCEGIDGIAFQKWEQTTSNRDAQLKEGEVNVCFTPVEYPLKRQLNIGSGGVAKILPPDKVFARILCSGAGGSPWCDSSACFVVASFAMRLCEGHLFSTSRQTYLIADSFFPHHIEWTVGKKVYIIIANGVSLFPIFSWRLGRWFNSFTQFCSLPLNGSMSINILGENDWRDWLATGLCMIVSHCVNQARGWLGRLFHGGRWGADCPVAVVSEGGATWHRWQLHCRR